MYSTSNIFNYILLFQELASVCILSSEIVHCERERERKREREREREREKERENVVSSLTILTSLNLRCCIGC